MRTSDSRGDDGSPLLRYGSERQSARRGARVPRGKALAFLALNGVAVLALLGVCVSMHSKISSLEGQLAAQTPDATSDAQREARDASESGRLPMALLPSKFAVDYVTPRQDQAYRGTCWDFATVGFLEQSYREHGVRKGWLASDEYVAFSEQAYGVEVMKLCSGAPGSPQQVDCRVAGDEMWNNSTEGGEVPELYYLRQGLQTSVFPQAVCKYYLEGGHDAECPGLEAARAAGNPLRFVVSAMATTYDDMSARELLVRRNQALPLSTPVASVTHYYPCIREFASSPHCQPESCTLCPPELAATTCCVPLRGGPSYNMEGEFLSHRGMSIEGGHAMLLVGYNDAFMTRDGFTGGLIVKNSWADGPGQGSHSLAYWMQEVSDWEERSVCPNSYNPFNWYQCGQAGGARSPEEAVQDCLTDETAMFARTNAQPLRLRCRDARRCRADGDVEYFVQSVSDWGDRMTVMCLWEYSPAQPNATRSLCLEPMLERDIARVLRPVEQEARENDVDRCGFYFIPYEALRRWIAQFQGFFVNGFDVEWHPQSYAANRDQFPELDYSLLLRSTHRQNHSDFLGPFPDAKVVPSFPRA